MNGLQFVSTPLGKRIRCLSICPPGTRGRVLSRRLAHAAQAPATSTPANLSPTSVTSITPPHSRLDADALCSLSQATTDALRSAKHALDRASIELIKSRRRQQQRQQLQQLQKSLPPLPQQHRIPPLNPSITGLTAIPTPESDTLLGRLLRAIDQREDLKAWELFQEMNRNMLLRQLKPVQLSALLQSLRPDAFLQLKERHRLGKDGKPYFLTEKQAFVEFQGKLTVVVRTILKLGHRLTTRDYNHLIDCARAGGDRKLASRLWDTLCGNNLQLDTWVYNSYMAAITGTASYERMFRVTDVTLAHRAKRESGDMRQRAQRVLEKMLAKGIAPNIRSICGVSQTAATRRAISA